MLLLSIYYRKGTGGKAWIKISTHKYCEHCDSILRIKSKRRSVKIDRRMKPLNETVASEYLQKKKVKKGGT